jgi:hypothetical protein
MASVAINVLDPEFYVDPWQAYRWLREQAPVYWDPVQKLWVISRYDDVLDVEKDTGRYSSSEGSRPLVVSAKEGEPASVPGLQAPLSGGEGPGKSGKHGIVADIQCGELQSLSERGRGNQVVTEADPGMGPAVLAHERRCPPSHLFADFEPLHAAEQAHDFAPLRRAHLPGDLGQAYDADGQGPGGLPGVREPVPCGRVAAQVLDQHVAVDQDHASASRSR